MPRKRLIDPGVFSSEGFAYLSAVGKVVFLGLILLADDEGRGRGEPGRLKLSLFPVDGSVSPPDVKAECDRLQGLGMAVFYEVEGRRYYWLTGWKNHQKVQHPSPSRIPAPPEIKGLSPIPPEDSRGVRKDRDQEERSGEERSGDPDLSSPRKPRAAAMDDSVHSAVLRVLDFYSVATGNKARTADRSVADGWIRDGWSVEVIKAGIMLGTHRAIQAGTKARSLRYFSGAVVDVGKAGGVYAAYILARRADGSAHEGVGDAETL